MSDIENANTLIRRIEGTQIGQRCRSKPLQRLSGTTDMDNLRQVLIAALLLLFVSACATPPNMIALNSDVAANIGSSNAVIVVTQEEITAEIDRSQLEAAAGGGLLFAIIDTLIEGARAKTAEELIEPIRESLIDYDFHAELVTTLRPTLESTDWLGVTRVESSTDPSSALHESLLQTGSEDSLVLMHASYGFSSDFKKLNTSVRIEVHPRAAALKASVESTRQTKAGHLLVYKNKVTHTEPVPMLATTKEGAVEAWMVDDGQAVRQALETSIEQLAAKLSQALLAPYRES